MIELEFPIEFVVTGVPVSVQASAKSKKRWMTKVQDAAKDAIPPQSFASTDTVAVTIYYFPVAASTVDIDNIIKPIIDALQGPVMCNDHQVARVVCQRFEPSGILDLENPSAKLLEAADAERPVTFVRIHTNLQMLE